MMRRAEHCSFTGAQALAQKLQRYWLARGETRHYEVRLLPGTQGVYGVREVAAPTVNRPETEKALPQIIVVKETPRERVRAIVRDVLKAHPDVPERSIFAKTLRPYSNRTAPVYKARRDCIRAVRTMTGWSLPHIAKMFHCHHASILYAVNDDYRWRHRERERERHRARKLALVAA